MATERLLTFEQARGCGIGEQANCCAFLLAGPEGFVCVQRSPSADLLYQRATEGGANAHRTPESDFPSCQSEGRS
jgi:hypothetical protein